MSGRNEYLGAAEVRSLIGKWQSIIGAAEGRVDIVGEEDIGADVRYNPFQRRPSPWARLVPSRSRDHRRLRNAGLAHRALVWGDPVALGEMDLLGAEEADTAVADAQEVAEAAASPTEGESSGDPRQWSVPPRNQLVDRPGPSRADRVLLPMSSGVSILPNTSAQITSRPQNVAFRPERVIIGGTAGDWIVNDIKVGNRSQFSQSGDVPGETFAATTIDSFVSFETVQTAMDFVMLVTYIGAAEGGAPFYCSVLGTAAI